MFEWTEERVSFMADACERTDFHTKLAALLSPYLKKTDSICDAGCGLGYLSLALSPLVGHVTAAERDDRALDVLRRQLARRHICNVTPLCTDVLAYTPSEPFDAMVFCFFGGMEDSERTVACYLPDYMTEEAFFENGPIACLRAAFYGKDVLTHRDILGALMGTGLRRDAVGDIWVQQGQCDFFVLSELVPYLMDNLTSAGRTALHVEQIPLSAAQRLPQRMRRLRITVSSPRLDGVLSAAFPLSLAGAAQAVAGGRVSLNDICCLKPEKQLAPGDVIALRGRGKLRVLSLDGETKKGRQALTIGIYE